MISKNFKIKLITSKTCFCYLSKENIKKFPVQSCVKVISHHEDILYFSVGPQNFEIEDDKLGISNVYAKFLNFKENDIVEATLLDNLPGVKSLILSTQSYDDYEILNLLASKIQNTVLNHVSVVNNNQIIILWVSGFMHITVDVDKVYPSSPGRLENFTEVIIKPPNKIESKDKNMVQDVDIKKNSEADTELEYINRILENSLVPKVYRIHPMDDLYNYDEKILNCVQLFDVFISKKHLPSTLAVKKSKEVNIFASLKLILPSFLSSQGILDENLRIENLTVRLLFFEEYFGTFKDEYSSFPVLFVNKVLLKNFNLKTGSKVILFNQLKNVNSISNMIILTPPKNTKIIKDKLKEYLAEICKNRSILLNSDILIPLKNENVYCSVKFESQKENFGLINSDDLRNMKYSVVEKDLQINFSEIDQKEKISHFLSNISNFSEIFENVNKIINFSFNHEYHLLEGIVISGKPGSGKTALVNYIRKQLSDFPYNFHFEYIGCNTLKGKTVDSLIRFFSARVINAIYYQPSILLIDDIEVICSKDIENSQMQEAVQVNRISEVLRDFLNTHIPHNQVQVIFTCENVSEINECLMPSRGKKIVWHSFKIAELNKNDIISMFEFLLLNKCNLRVDKTILENCVTKMDGFVAQDVVDFVNKLIFETIKEGVEELSSKHFDNVFSKFTQLSLKDVKIQIPENKDFSDVGGLEEAKTALIESLLWPLQYPSLFNSAPLRLQTGALLYGPPGTGKTLLAEAAAKQCNIRLIAVKGPELLSKYIGASEQGVRNIFEKAMSAKPCVLFFDEFDSLAPRRGHDSTGVTDRVVNQLLTQLDGVEGLNGVCVIAATSRPDLLDSALLRPGRLDKQIFCSLPDFKTRIEILKVLSKNVRLKNDVNLEEIAKLTENYSGADLRGILSTAQIEAVEEAIKSNTELDEDPEIDQNQFKNALNNTRPSLSPEERLKYDKIYQKFQGNANVFDLFGEKQKATLA